MGRIKIKLFEDGIVIDTYGKRFEIQVEAGCIYILKPEANPINDQARIEFSTHECTKEYPRWSMSSGPKKPRYYDRIMIL